MSNYKRSLSDVMEAIIGRDIPPPAGGRLGGGRVGQATDHPAPSPTLPLREREPNHYITPGMHQHLQWRGHFPVYQEAYQLRMLKLLEGAYPTLLHYIGTADFQTLANNYIAHHPSHHFNIDRYPIAFGISIHSDNAIVNEIGRIESETAAVYRKEESTPIAPDWITTQTEISFADAKLTLRAASALCAFDYNVNDYAQALRAGENPPTPQAYKNWLLIYRHQHQLQRLVLSEGEYSLLTLLNGSMTLAEALEHERFAPYSKKALESGEFMQWFARLNEKGCLCLSM